MSFRTSSTFTSSALNVAADATLDFGSNTFTFSTNKIFTGDGVVRVNDSAHLVAPQNGVLEFFPELELIGELDGPGSYKLDIGFKWTNGSIEKGALVVVSGQTEISGPKDKLIDNSALLNLGDLTWSDNGDILLNNAKITNLGTFDIRNDASILSNGGTNLIQNGSQAGANGLFFKSSSKSTPNNLVYNSIGVPFENYSTVQLHGFTINFDQGFTQFRGRIDLEGGELKTKKDKSIVIEDGILSGIGTIDADLVLSGTLDLGEKIGTLTLLRNFTLTPAAKVIIWIGVDAAGNTVNDQIDVKNEDATLSGSLKIELKDAKLKAGDSFTILKSTGRVGKFKKVELPDLGKALKWAEPTYTKRTVILSVV